MEVFYLLARAGVVVRELPLRCGEALRSAVPAAPLAVMATLRTPLYKEYLTPALHRRFTNAAVIVLGFCYIEAILIADKSSCELPDPHFMQTSDSHAWKTFGCGSLWARLALEVYCCLFPHSPSSSSGLLSSTLASLSHLLIPEVSNGDRRRQKHPIPIQDFYRISPALQYSPNLSVVSLLGLVVQRGLRLVRASIC